MLSYENPIHARESMFLSLNFMTLFGFFHALVDSVSHGKIGMRDALSCGGNFKKERIKCLKTR